MTNSIVLSAEPGNMSRDVIDFFIEFKEAILNDWAEYFSVDEIYPRLGFTKTQFVNEMARDIFNRIMALLESGQKPDETPFMHQVAGRLHDAGLQVEEVFMFYTALKNVLLLWIDRCSMSGPECKDTLMSVMDLKLNKILGIYTDALQQTAALLEPCSPAMHDDHSFGARIDPLTGFFNRGSFEMKLLDQMKISRTRRSAISLVIINIDRSGTLNQLTGKDEEEALIKSFAEIILNNTPRHAVCARCGRSEFAFILSGVGETSARAISERIGHAAKERLDFAASLAASQHREGESPHDFCSRVHALLNDTKHNAAAECSK